MRGTNKKNLDWWLEFYLNQGYDFELAYLKSKVICQGQDIEINRERIIKLEKKLNKLTKKI